MFLLKVTAEIDYFPKYCLMVDDSRLMIDRRKEIGFQSCLVYTCWACLLKYKTIVMDWENKDENHKKSNNGDSNDWVIYHFIIKKYSKLKIGRNTERYSKNERGLKGRVLLAHEESLRGHFGLMA